MNKMNELWFKRKTISVPDSCCCKGFDLHPGGMLLISLSVLLSTQKRGIPPLAAPECAEPRERWKALLLLLTAVPRFSSLEELLASWKNVSALAVSCYQTHAGCSFYS